MFASSVDRKPYPVLLPGLLDKELVQPPPPPEDLPKPWDGLLWRRLFTLGFFITVFGLWRVGVWFDMSFMEIRQFAGSFTLTAGLYLFLGLYLINRFQLRGYYANYAARANKPLNKSIYRYRRRKASENLYQLFPRYMIGGEAYYLVWYVPNTSLRITRPLKPGSEPLLFNDQGEWLDDEALFQKALMMWFYGREMSPGTLDSSLTRSYNGLRRMISRYLPRLPRLLKINAELFEASGLGAELALVASAYEAKCALFRNSLQMLLAKHLWATAHGGDSLTQLRYEDILRYHEVDEAAIEARRRFAETHALEQAEAAALTMRRALLQRGAQGRRWKQRKELDESLQVFAAPNPAGESYSTHSDEGWQGSQDSAMAYRARVAYARELDAQRSVRKAAAKGQ